MKDVEILQVETIDGFQEIAIVKSETGFISMPKSVWDELEAAKEANGTLS